MAKKIKNRFNDPLCQNNLDWHKYTVFTLKFNGVPIRFVTEKDAENVVNAFQEEHQKYVDMSSREIARLMLIIKQLKKKK